MMPGVSILVPVYNAEKYLEQCLDSIVNQTYQNLQVVLINDGSSDRSSEICRYFANNYPYIELYEQSNSGVGETRNRLLEKIRGKYFLFVDSDDWMEPEMVEILVDVLESSDTDIAICDKIVESGKVTHNELKRQIIPEIWDQKKAVELFLYHERFNGSLWNKLIKTDIAKDIKFDSTVSYGEDALFVWGCLQNANSISVIDIKLYHYRINQESISHQKFGAKKLSSHKVWNTFAKETACKWPEFTEIAKANYAVCDFWLLVFAAKDSYPYDDNIRLFKNNLKNHLSIVRKHSLLSLPKYILAISLITSYRFSRYMLRGMGELLNF